MSRSANRCRGCVDVVIAVCVVLMILLVPISSTVICPTMCRCSYSNRIKVNCSNQGLTTYPENVTELVELLDLSGNLLTELPDDVDLLAELQYLNLARNKLSTLPAVLEGLKNLKILDLSENKVSDPVNVTSISQLRRLEVLILSKNPISTLAGLKSDVLTAIDASYCDIRELTDASLATVPNLKGLSLVGNPLKIVTNPFAMNLEMLDLSNCQLNHLHPNTLAGFPMLVELNLANNVALDYCNRYETLRHSNLQKLDVSGCNLDRPGLHGFPALTQAKLSRNPIRMLPDRIFAKNQELTHLYLDYNYLHSLNRSTFAGLTNLGVLDVSANSLNHVHWASFREMESLKVLNLSQNNLNRLPNLTSSIESLDLSSNLIQFVDKDSLSSMPKLRYLNLSQNHVRELPIGLQSNILKILNLQNNHISKLEVDSFAKFPDLQRLDLSGNMLSNGIDPAIFKKILDLRSVRLNNNPWNCNCSEFYASYVYLTTQPTKTSVSSLLCYAPHNVSGYTWEAACYNTWTKSTRNSKNRTWGLVLISLLIGVVVFGSIVSVRHTMNLKRLARVQREEMERTEVRERLRLLQRRNQRLEEEIRDHSIEPRRHPLELVGPPSYEEAVHMPRLVQSLDGLDTITADQSAVNFMTASSESLRSKKRRTRRPRRKTQSDESLARREFRREERLRKCSRLSVNDQTEPGVQASANDKTPNILTAPSATKETARRSVTFKSTTNILGQSCSEDHESDSTNNKIRTRPPTPSTKNKMRRRIIRTGTSTDDEDSEVQSTTVRKTRPSMVIRNLPKEPRSGYRAPATDSDLPDSSHT